MSELAIDQSLFVDHLLLRRFEELYRFVQLLLNDEDFNKTSSLKRLSFQVGYGLPFDMNKEDTNTIWGSRPDRRKRDTLMKGTLRGRRKGTLKVPGQVVILIIVVVSLPILLLST